MSHQSPAKVNISKQEIKPRKEVRRKKKNVFSQVPGIVLLNEPF
jgi:hypothetical protein